MCSKNIGLLSCLLSLTSCFFRRMEWAGYVARMGERRGVYRSWWGNLKERNDMEDPAVDGRIILRWILRNWDEVGAWTGWIWLRIGTGDEHL